MAIEFTPATVVLRGHLYMPDHWTLEQLIFYPIPDWVKNKYQGPDEVVVKTGFVTDLASIPRIFWNLLPPFGRYSAAAVIHDYLYQAHEHTRAHADAVFLASMMDLQVRPWKRQTMYWAVRVFGSRAWSKGPGKGGIV